MPREALGEFEKMVLLAILQLEGESYGAPILEEIEDRTGRTASSGALYVALRRLEKKGLVTSRLGDPTPERGGRAKRFFRIQPAAVRQLRDAQQAWEQMAEGLDRLLGSQ